MPDFIGLSGKFYVKNPVDNCKFSFAVYQSRDTYATPFNRGYIGHLSSEEAYKDFKEDVGGFEFTVKIRGLKDEKIRVSVDGNMENGENFKEYLAGLINTNGRENVNYSYERI